MMKWMLDNKEWLLSGVGVALCAFLFPHLFKYIKQFLTRRKARICLKIPEELCSKDIKFGVLHVRDGKDEVADSGPLLNRPHYFRNIDNCGMLEATIRFSRRLGFQFKCFADLRGISFGEAKAILEKNGYLEITKGEGKQDRLWLIHFNYSTCVTVDGIKNNFWYPE